MDTDDLLISKIHKEFQNIKIDYSVAEQLLYSINNKSKRFKAFIALYEATLKDDIITAAKVFREAYCASNNIHTQIKNSQFEFNLKSYLNKTENQGVKFLDLMNKDENHFYNSLPDRIKIYRGLCEEEYKSGNYGISWTLDEQEGKKYAYLVPNNVDDGKGGLINLEIEKKDILTVFSVHNSDGIKHEIIYVTN